MSSEFSCILIFNFSISTHLSLQQLTDGRPMAASCPGAPHCLQHRHYCEWEDFSIIPTLPSPIFSFPFQVCRPFLCLLVKIRSSLKNIFRNGKRVFKGRESDVDWSFSKAGTLRMTLHDSCRTVGQARDLAAGRGCLGALWPSQCTLPGWPMLLVSRMRTLRSLSQC